MRRLFRCGDHFAEDTTALVDRLEVNFLDEVEPELAAHHLTGDQDDRGAIAVGFVQTVDEVQAVPGPQLPVTAVRRSMSSGAGPTAAYAERTHARRYRDR
jgi:hypothetical protein